MLIYLYAGRFKAASSITFEAASVSSFFFLSGRAGHLSNKPQRLFTAAAAHLLACSSRAWSAPPPRGREQGEWRGCCFIFLLLSLLFCLERTGIGNQELQQNRETVSRPFACRGFQKEKSNVQAISLSLWLVFVGWEQWQPQTGIQYSSFEQGQTKWLKNGTTHVC